LSILKTNDEVNAQSVGDAFTQVARKVKGHPEDTVVVFIAGHTGVLDEHQYCLLLPRFPFPADAPLMVAARGANTPIASGAKVGPEAILPYSIVALNLMRLEALNRLVIVDACQAEAIFSDPQVAGIRKWMEIGSRKPRTSYLMAARRGEPALEIGPLGHGLFTYTLLRGMREVALEKEPKEITNLKLRPDADYNGDGIITSAELDTYVQRTLPPIAAIFPSFFVRGPEIGATAAAGHPATSEKVDQALQLQTARISFPLIQLGTEGGARP
jgi:uncharacterized caspase-like protein